MTRSLLMGTRFLVLMVAALAAAFGCSGPTTDPELVAEIAAAKAAKARKPKDPAKMFVDNPVSKDIWDRLQDVENLDEAAREKLFADLLGHLKTVELTDESLDLGIIVAQVLFEGEQQGVAYEEIAHIVARTDDPGLAARATMLEGTARQFQLIGEKIEIEGVTLDGEQVTLADYQGKVVLVDFWATWCGACIEELPNLQANYDKYHDRGFEVIGITADKDEDAVREYLDEKQLPWKNLFDAESSGHPMAIRFGVIASPTVFLVDRDGTVLSIEARGEELGRLLEGLLGEGGAEPAAEAPAAAAADSDISRSDPPAASPAPVGDLEVVTNSIGMKLARIPAGSFSMGSDDDAADELPRHRVEITRPFLLGVYEVTQQEYQQVTGANPSSTSKDDANRQDLQGKDTSRFPVDNISWLAAVKFCNRLSTKEQLVPCYKIDGSEVACEKGDGYRLPTEAEWEYACRGGTSTRWHFGDDQELLSEYGWVAQKRPHPVGAKKPNPFGLYDMYGNVWEKCDDWYKDDYYAASPEVDPRGAASGVHRLIRGGSWFNEANRCRSGNREHVHPASYYNNFGFRVARSAPQEPETPVSTSR